jgi:exodeoxyribonuclease-3
MRIATWNINGVRARLDFLLQWLAERQPDLVGLQELKVPDEQFPWVELEKAGYHAAVFGQKSWNGVAVLAREPVEVVQRGLPGQDAAGARLVTARAGDLLFTSVYCPNGKHTGHDDFPRKLAWYDALAAHLASQHRADAPLVLGGDFNVCPTALDSYDEAALAGHIFHTDEERARFRRLLDWGLVDLHRKLQPDSRAFSWWDYRAGNFHRNEGLRIDFVLATGPIARRAVASEIDREYRKKKDGLIASDHAPVMIDLEA